MAHRARSQDWADSAAPTRAGMPNPCTLPASCLFCTVACGFPPPPHAFLPGQPAGSASVRVHAGSRPLRGSRPSLHEGD